MDLTTLTDEELDQLRIDVLNEQERRQIEATYPAQIEEMSARYKRATGEASPPVDAATRGVDRTPQSTSRPVM